MGASRVGREERLGHGDVLTTMRKYGHLFEGVQQRLAVDLDAAHAGPPPPAQRRVAWSRSTRTTSNELTRTRPMAACPVDGTESDLTLGAESTGFARVGNRARVHASGASASDPPPGTGGRA